MLIPGSDARGLGRVRHEGGRNKRAHAVALAIAILGSGVALGAVGLDDPRPATPADLDRPLACPEPDAACERAQRAWAALQGAAAWLARYPEAGLQLDAAMMLSQARQSVDGAALRQASAAAERVADRDHDHPHRRFYRPDFHSPPEHTSRWIPPAAGAPRASPNAVLSEALHCSENGFRPETIAYVCGPMRDDGGYHSTHALLGLVLARERGCVDLGATSKCLASLQAELARAQPSTLQPKRSLDVDLYGERILMRLLGGTEASALDPEVDALLAFQDADGSFGVRASGEPPYHRYHTTGIVVWTLAEWHRRSGEARPPAGPAGS